MKKIVFIVTLMLASFSLSANNIIYFTHSQASRTVSFLNAQDEIMLYYGYADEIPTYVILDEVWAEQFSATFYEIWIYGWDAYTGEEVFMPIDLGGVWLLRNGSIYSAAQYLRFRSTHVRPAFVWDMPCYNAFVRGHHRPINLYYTYHYDIHRHGWRYDHYYAHHHHCHPYYNRHPSHPAPKPHYPFTPGHDAPAYRQTSSGYEYLGSNTTGSIVSARATTISNNQSPTERYRNGNVITSTRSTGETTTTNRSELQASRGVSSNASAASRGNAENKNSSVRSSSDATRSTSSRGDATATSSTSSRGNATATSSTSSRGNATATSNTSSRGNATATSSTSSRGNATATSSTSSRGSATTTSSTSSRGTTTATSSTSSRGTSTSTKSGSTATRSGSVSSSSTRSGSTSANSGSTATRSTSTSSNRGTTTDGTVSSRSGSLRTSTR